MSFSFRLRRRVGGRASRPNQGSIAGPAAAAAAAVKDGTAIASVAPINQRHEWFCSLFLAVILMIALITVLRSSGADDRTIDSGHIAEARGD